MLAMLHAHSATLETVDFELSTEFWSKQIGLSCDELWHLLGFANRKTNEICNIDFFYHEKNVGGLQPLNTTWDCLQTFFLSGDIFKRGHNYTQTEKREYKMDFV